MWLPRARITGSSQEAGAFIAVKRPGMKEAWFLACDERVESAEDAVAIYGVRFTIEETFRDQQDPRFGFGINLLHISDPVRRDRLLMLMAIAQVALTLLGAAGEDCGMDKDLHKRGGMSNKGKRVYSLFRQGCIRFELLYTMREDRRKKLIESYDRILLEHRLFADLIGIIWSMMADLMFMCDKCGTTSGLKPTVLLTKPVQDGLHAAKPFGGARCSSVLARHRRGDAALEDTLVTVVLDGGQPVLDGLSRRCRGLQPADQEDLEFMASWGLRLTRFGRV